MNKKKVEPHWLKFLFSVILINTALVFLGVQLVNHYSAKQLEILNESISEQNGELLVIPSFPYSINDFVHMSNQSTNYTVNEVRQSGRAELADKIQREAKEINDTSATLLMGITHPISIVSLSLLMFGFVFVSCLIMHWLSNKIKHDKAKSILFNLSKSPFFVLALVIAGSFTLRT